VEEGRALARRGSRVDEPAAYHAEGILYLPAEARFNYLLNRPEAENIGAKVNAAMRDIEKHNSQLFWFKALVIASNGTDYCVNSLMADWEVRAHGQTDSQMVAIRLQ
jgi:type I restriction-modification system DNA methylase subunit